jgi:hypothetical protein
VPWNEEYFSSQSPKPELITISEQVVELRSISLELSLEVKNPLKDLLNGCDLIPDSGLPEVAPFV